MTYPRTRIYHHDENLEHGPVSPVLYRLMGNGEFMSYEFRTGIFFYLAPTIKLLPPGKEHTPS